MKRVGIVGAAYAGKSTLFDALTRTGAAGSRASVAVASVPDPRVDTLSRLHASRKSVYARLEFSDPSAANPGAPLGAAVLGALREADALAIVVRGFGADPEPEQELRRAADELALADLAVLSGAAERAAKRGRLGEQAARGEAEVLTRAVAVLEAGRPLRSEPFTPEELRVLRTYAPLTGKPAVLVLSVDDEAAADQADRAGRLAGALHPDTPGLAVPARLESEVAGMDPAEAAELLAEFGVTTGALPAMVAAAYRTLDLLTFLTAGEDESRAWEVRRGARAPEAAGAIHTDLQRGFIRAEVVGFDDLVAAGSWDAARAAGRLRVEGKDYEVAEGDVMNIRFAV